MAGGSGKNPFAAFRFLVEITGLVAGGFSEVAGLQAETETEEYREGGVNGYIHKLPKVTKSPPLVLKRGLADTDTLWKWHREVAAGIIKRKSGCVILLDAAGGEKWRWTFLDAYPVKWSGPEFRGDSSALAVETLELVHRGISKG